MPITLGTNIASLKAQQQLAKGSDALSKVFERLSSGMRINRASDDAAGLSIASALTSTARLYSQAIRNANDGLSLLNVADSALESLSDITIRQLELAEQAANGTLSTVQRRSIHREASALTSEYNRIVATTTFNGINVLDLSSQSVALQVGTNAAGFISVSLGSEIDRAIGVGTFRTGPTQTINNGYDITSGDFNGDGIADIVSESFTTNTVSVLLGNGDGSFLVQSIFTTGAGPNSVVTGDLNGDGRLDLVLANNGSTTASVLLGNGNGSFTAATLYGVGGASSNTSILGDFNADGTLDIATSVGANISLLLGNGNGSFKSAALFAGAAVNGNLTASDVNSDGKLDLISADAINDTVAVLLGTGTGSFASPRNYTTGAFPMSPTVADFNNDGYSDLVVNNRDDDTASVLLGNGDGTYKAQSVLATGLFPDDTAVADINGDGFADFLTGENNSFTMTLYLGNGDGTFQARRSTATGGAVSRIVMADLNRDGVEDVTITSATLIRTFLADTVQSASIRHHYLLTQSGAREALDNLALQAQRIQMERASIGAFTSRLNISVAVAASSRESFLAAASRITDADIALESSELIRRQIQQQAAAAILSQANQEPRLALALLTGGFG